MAKLNLLLLLVLIVCALGLVTSQHESRKLFSRLDRELERARAIEVEFGQLQLESSTWGLHSRVEKIAAGKLGMRTPDPRRVRMVSPHMVAPQDTPAAGTQQVRVAEVRAAALPAAGQSGIQGR